MFKKIFIFSIMISAIFIACNNNKEVVEEENDETKCIDADGREYKTVTIGEQLWMAENLAVNIQGSWAIDNDESKVDDYGRLYLIEAAENACPEGWRLSTKQDWLTLFDEIGGKDSAYLKLMSADANMWEEYQGTDDYGFSVVGTGYMSDPSFLYFNQSTGFLNMREGDDGYISIINFTDEINVNSFSPIISEDYAYSVRCIRD